MGENRKDHRREVDKLLCDVVEDLLELPRLGLRREQIHTHMSSYSIEVPRALMDRLLEAQALCQD